MQNAPFSGVHLSSSKVGYQQIDTPSGFSMRTPTFKAITGNMKIADIGVTGAFGAGMVLGVPCTTT